jgi:small GTP-binding protein
VNKDAASTITASDDNVTQESRRRQGSDQRIKLTIWDTAGQERFRTLTSSYYRGAQGVVIVYDTSKRSTFDNVEAIWTKELDTYADMDEMTLMVVGNKVDKVCASPFHTIIIINRRRNDKCRRVRERNWRGVLMHYSWNALQRPRSTYKRHLKCS